MSYTNQELANAIDSEGGIYSALRYGIVTDEIEDPTVRARWNVLEMLFAMTERWANRVNELLPEPWQENR